MYVVAVFIMAIKWKQFKCPSTNEQIYKRLYSMKSYGAMTRKEVMIYLSIQINVENIQLSERNQSQETIY